VVHFFRDIVGVAEVSKEVLSQRTNDYQRWVEAYARAEAGAAWRGTRLPVAEESPSSRRSLAGRHPL
jgi:hypothetical protein